LTTLQGSTNSILSQISALSSSGQANSDNITPLINQLTDSFNTTSTSLSTLQPENDSENPQVPFDQIAELISAGLQGVLTTLDGIVTLDVPTLLATVDVALSTLLADVGFLLPGVLTLVSDQQAGISVLLSELDFTLTANVLGL